MHSIEKHPFIFLALLSLAGACAVETAASPDDRHPIGKADLIGSCASADESGANSCGGQSIDGICYCDESCDGYGDCCSDKAVVCDGATPETPPPNPPDGGLGAGLDVNGDGYGDLVVAATGASGPIAGDGNAPREVGKVFIYYGGPTGLASEPSEEIAPSGGHYFGTYLSDAGDLKADGKSALLISSGAFVQGSLYPSPDNKIALHQYSTPMTYTNPVAALGDIDGDGAADFAVGALDRIYIYSMSNGSRLYAETIESPDPTQSWGPFVFSAGDVNGDGYPDMLTGSSQNPTGQLYLFLGGPQGLSAPTQRIEDVFYGGSAAVAAAGDLNGDGFGDVVVGNVGKEVYVLFGNADGLAASPGIVLSPPEASTTLFGQGLSLGDVNGDGHVDLAVSARDTVYVYFGTGSGMASQPALTLRAPAGHRRDGFASSVTTSGDYDGDGFSDIAIGAPGAPATATADGPGRVYIYQGGPTGPSTLPSMVIESPEKPYATHNSWYWPLFGASVL